MRATKILHIIPSFGLGGMEKVICSIINHTFYQYQHIILSLDGDNRALRWIRTNNIQQIEFYKDARFALYLKKLYKEIKKIDDKVRVCFYGAFKYLSSEIKENQFIQKPIQNKDLIKIINEIIS